MNQNIELLAPAGDYKSFIGAINAGANAVYIAGKEFGARKYASNFTNEEIKELIEYAHIRNVKVFVTINTLVFDDEIERLLVYTDYLVTNQVDALIVQDLGMIEVFVKRYPDTEIHASTQMNTHSIEQLRYLKEIGVNRAILARETNLKTIKEMRNHVDLDLEVFVHGALCVSYSGNCLFSAFNGGRSGYRGECAQPCRLQYSLYQEDTLVTRSNYLLSTKDLLSINTLKDIIESGVSSLKVEGRMKKPEYVIATIRAYREAIDYITQNKPFDLERRLKELMSVFNREYTKGFILDELPYNINNPYRPNHLGITVGKVLDFQKGKTKIKLTDTLNEGDGIRIIGKDDLGGKVDKIIKQGKRVNVAYKNDEIIIDLPKRVSKNDTVHLTQNKTLETSLSPYLNKNYKLVPLEGEMNVYVDKAVEVYIKTPFSNYITFKTDYICVKANNPKQLKEVLYTQFNKLGDTPYYLDNFNVSTDGISFIPNSVLKQLRRDVLKQLEKSYNTIRKVVKERNNEVLNIDITHYHSVKVETLEQYQIVKDYPVDFIYVPETLEVEEDIRNLVFRNRISNYKKQGDLVIRDFGDSFKNSVSDSTLNVTNHHSLYNLHKKGVKRVTLSKEISLDQMRYLIDTYQKTYNHIPNCEVILYGKPELMVTKYCPITKGTGLNKMNCGLCEKYTYTLRQNDKEYGFVRDSGCVMKIIHHQAIDNLRKKHAYLNADVTNFRVDFTNESPKTVHKILNNFLNKTA